jgi:hypothetical protein
MDSGAEKVGSGCFLDCYDLCEVTFEEYCRLKEIVLECFDHCSVKSIAISKSVEKN